MGKQFGRQDHRRNSNSGPEYHEREQHNYHRDDDGGERQRPARAPLAWNVKAQFRAGFIVGEITEAVTDRGETLRSFTIGRAVPDRNGGGEKVMKHVNFDNMADYDKVYGEIRAWYKENVKQVN